MRPTKRSLFQVKGRTLVTSVYIYIYLDLPKGAKWFLKGANLPSLRVSLAPLGRCWYILFEFIGSHMLTHLSFIQYYIKGHFGRYVQRHFDDVRRSKKCLHLKSLVIGQDANKAEVMSPTMNLAASVLHLSIHRHSSHHHPVSWPQSVGMPPGRGGCFTRAIG